MRYNFEWDIKKAKANLRKHRVSFERAATIFLDPNLLSIPDQEHSDLEDRWITIGMDESGSLLVLSHKFENVSRTLSKIRVISARKATRKETKQYEEGI
jgi:hypothetical protein